MKIQLFTTGGTFDKEYNELTGELYFNKSHIHEILKLGRCKVPVTVKNLMMIDSLQMTSSHREVITQNCIDSKSSKIVITHGTDTMVTTAKNIASKNIAKTIVLTGAMIPYKFKSSDGIFNLGSSLAFVQTLPHGVYISMNGQIFKWDNVQKNKHLGIFEKTTP